MCINTAHKIGGLLLCNGPESQEGFRVIARSNPMYNRVHCGIRNVDHSRWSEKESHRCKNKRG